MNTVRRIIDWSYTIPPWIVWTAFLTYLAALVAVNIATGGIGWYWSPPNTVDGNGGITILNGMCGFEVRGHVGPFCNVD